MDFHVLRKVEELPNADEKKMIQEYYEACQLEPVYCDSTLSALRNLKNKDGKRVYFVQNRWQRKVISVMKGRAKYTSEVLEKAKEFCALKDMFIALQERGISCFMFNRIAFLKDQSVYTESAQRRIREKISFPKIMENPEQYEADLREVLGDKYSLEYVNELGKISQIVKAGRKYVHQDSTSKYVNVVNGKRIVPNQPEQSEHTIHVFGRCGVFGYAVEDAETFPAYLQQQLNENGYSNYKVENHGLWGADNSIIDYNMMYEARAMKPGDVLLIYMRHYDNQLLKVFKENGLQYFDCTKAYHEYPDSKMSFYDKPGHMTAKGYKIVAKLVFEQLKESNFGQDYRSDLTNKSTGYYLDYVKEKEQDSFLKELDEYLEDIYSNYIKGHENEKIGAIIMNCNPFTRGHRYLIEYASKQVDYLLVFILEEDRSFFKFKDRFEMVKLGTADLKNVLVLPSKEFMISALTFPEYFMKDYSQTKEIDVTQDLSIFGEIIAPKLQIKVRFAGQEPTDMVTRSYNENMKKILPGYGIEFVEIPRLTTDGKEDVISASKVRKALKEEDYEKLKNYVPETTFNYLMEHYKGRC